LAARVADWVQRRFGLQGRSALVTGGGSGVGGAIAEGLGAAGARLVLVGRDEARLVRAARGLRGAGVEVDYVAADLACAEGVEHCVSRALGIVPGIDILVNAAGFNIREPFMKVSEASWNQHLSIHLTAPFFLTQRLAPGMKRKGWGRIINIASLQSVRAFADSAAYGAAKGGVVQLTRAMAEEWSRHGVTCNAIAPGFFPTALTAKIFDDEAQAAAHAAGTMTGRNGRLEDLHGVAVFLASDASSYVTGQTIYVDGGYSAR